MPARCPSAGGRRRREEMRRQDDCGRPFRSFHGCCVGENRDDTGPVEDCCRTCDGSFLMVRRFLSSGCRGLAPCVGAESRWPASVPAEADAGMTRNNAQGLRTRGSPPGSFPLDQAAALAAAAASRAASSASSCSSDLMMPNAISISSSSSMVMGVGITPLPELL